MSFVVWGGWHGRPEEEKSQSVPAPAATATPQRKSKDAFASLLREIEMEHDRMVATLKSEILTLKEEVLRLKSKSHDVLEDGHMATRKGLVKSASREFGALGRRTADFSSVLDSKRQEPGPPSTWTGHSERADRPGSFDRHAGGVELEERSHVIVFADTVNRPGSSAASHCGAISATTSIAGDRPERAERTVDIGGVEICDQAFEDLDASGPSAPTSSPVKLVGGWDLQSAPGSAVGGLDISQRSRSELSGVTTWQDVKVPTVALGDPERQDPDAAGSPSELDRSTIQRASTRDRLRQSVSTYTSAPSEPYEARESVVERSKLQISSLTKRTSSDYSTKADRCVISPVSKIRLCWDAFAFAVLLLDLWLTPFELIFLGAEVVPDIFDQLNLCVTCFWVCDILLNFTTGYIERDMLILKRWASIRKYMSFWFWIDLIATIPYDQILGAASQVNPNFLSFTRLSKVTKGLKTIRFLKVIRATRLVQNMDRASYALEDLPWLANLARLLQLVSFLVATSHIHGCLWSLLQPQIRSVDDVDEALDNYYQSFRWAINILTLGSPGETPCTNWAVCLFEMAVAVERLIALTAFGAWAMTKAMVATQEEAHFNLLKTSAMRFFRKHNVSVETQIQVLYCLFETRAAHFMQRHFRQLVSENLPEELRRTVSEELWVPHLLSLGLIVHAKSWHPDFLTELSLVVREEVFSSKTMICKEGSASTAAYYILQGHLATITTIGRGQRADFYDGMWVGEQCFVSPLRRRNGTIVAQVLTRLMVVPSDGFRDLLARLNITDLFQDFVKSHLEQGLCGRCGGVGDHFTHVCPVRSHVVRPRRQHSQRRLCCLRSNAEESAVCQYTVEGDGGSDETQWHSFLHAHRLLPLLPLLSQHEIRSLHAFDNLSSWDVLKFQAEDEEMRNQIDELKALQEERREELLQRLSEDKPFLDQHLAFLSHFKIEAGTEAVLMRGELEACLKDRAAPTNVHFAQMLHAPIFLDSEDLSDLGELQARVRQSHNLVLLLSPRVLERPWVLIEIVTALDADIPILPVQLVKPGAEFVYPDEAFYERLRNGDLIDDRGQALLDEQDIGPATIEAALRQVFRKIAVPYSPHRNEGIRKAELAQLVKQFRMKSPGGEDGDALVKYMNSVVAEDQIPSSVGHARTEAPAVPPSRPVQASTSFSRTSSDLLRGSNGVLSGWLKSNEQPPTDGASSNA